MPFPNEASIPDKIIATLNAITEKLTDEIRQQLISSINELINTDFNALLQLLYRIDIDEKKLKQLLKSYSDTDASSIIADLIITRQLQKKETRGKFSNRNKPGDEDDW